jgi:hypothetical protein
MCDRGTTPVHADEGSQVAEQHSDVSDGGSVLRHSGDESGVPVLSKREIIFREIDILRALPDVPLYVDSDGYRGITAYLGARPVDDFELTSRPMVLALARKLPLTLRVQYHSWWPRLVWIDQEYVSLDFRPEGFYYVTKRKELGL